MSCPVLITSVSFDVPVQLAGGSNDRCPCACARQALCEANLLLTRIGDFACSPDERAGPAVPGAATRSVMRLAGSRRRSRGVGVWLLAAVRLRRAAREAATRRGRAGLRGGHRGRPGLLPPGSPRPIPAVLVSRGLR